MAKGLLRRDGAKCNKDMGNGTLTQDPPLGFQIHQPGKIHTLGQWPQAPLR